MMFAINKLIWGLTSHNFNTIEKIDLKISLYNKRVLNINKNMNPNQINTYIYKCVIALDKHQELNAFEIVRLPSLPDTSNYIVDVDTGEGFVGPNTISRLTFQTQDDINNGYTVVTTKNAAVNNNFRNGTCLWHC